jgi:hypothetical protein
LQGPVTLNIGREIKRRSVFLITAIHMININIIFQVVKDGMGLRQRGHLFVGALAGNRNEV